MTSARTMQGAGDHLQRRIVGGGDGFRETPVRGCSPEHEHHQRPLSVSITGESHRISPLKSVAILCVCMCLRGREYPFSGKGREVHARGGAET